MSQHSGERPLVALADVEQMAETFRRKAIYGSGAVYVTEHERDNVVAVVGLLVRAVRDLSANLAHLGAASDLGPEAEETLRSEILARKGLTDRRKPGRE